MIAYYSKVIRDHRQVLMRDLDFPGDHHERRLTRTHEDMGSQPTAQGSREASGEDRGIQITFRHGHRTTLFPDRHQRHGLSGRSRFPGRMALHERCPAHHVSRQIMDDEAVCWIRHSRGFEQAVQVPPGTGADRDQCRIRSSNTDGIRFRP